MEWQPISTAPQDATPVDIWRSNWGERRTDMHRVELSPGNVFYSDGNGLACVRDASHWMPIPAAPVAQEG